VFAIYAPQNLARLQQAFREEVTRVQRDGFNAVELENAKSGLLQSRRLSRAQDGPLAGGIASQLELGRTMAFAAKIDRDIEALTLEQANAAFRKYVDASKLVFVYAGDFAKTGK
jgi:zinc protease